MSAAASDNFGKLKRSSQWGNVFGIRETMLPTQAENQNPLDHDKNCEEGKIPPIAHMFYVSHEKKTIR